MSNDYGLSSPEELKDLVVQSLDADKAFDISFIELEEDAGLADYMVIASGTSSRHVQSLAEKLKTRLNIIGLKDLTAEGINRGDWVAIDAGDVIVHLFRPEVREFYNLEKMWGAIQPFETVGSRHVTA